MTALPCTTISPSDCASQGTSPLSASTTRKSPLVKSSTPWRALILALSPEDSAACSGSGAQTLMKGDVSVSPYTWVTSQPSSPSTLSIVTAAGGAPAVTTWTPFGSSPRVSAGAFARAIRTVGAAQDRKSTRLNSSHLGISYAVFCLKKKKKQHEVKLNQHRAMIMMQHRYCRVFFRLRRAMPPLLQQER